MFPKFRKSSVAMVVEETSVAAPSRVAVESRMPDLKREKEWQEYTTIAESVGLLNGAMRGKIRNQKHEMLLQFLKETGIGFYPYEKVEACLDNIFGRPRFSWSEAKWGWQSLRNKECDALMYGDGPVPVRNPFLHGVYPQAIPMPVLFTVQQIVEAIPDACFYVSAQVTKVIRDPDPFLSVAILFCPMLVIERWDEPSFRA